MTEHSDTAKNVIDVIAPLAAIGSFLELISPVFGLIGAILAVMRIAEMVTGKDFVDLIRKKKDAVDE
jgi:L-lactate permease